MEEEEKEEKVSSKNESLLEKHYFENARKGIVLSLPDLKTYCEKVGIEPRPTEKVLKSLRYRWKYIAIHARWARPAHYMGSAIDRLGNIQVDVAQFKPNLAVANKRKFILLVGVDHLTQKLACIAFPNKKQSSWEKGLVQMITQDFNCVRKVISDRDVAIMGASWQSRMQKTYNIDFIQLKSRSKAYAAERAIRTLKTKLSLALSLNPKGDLNWEKHLPKILEEYNSHFVKGTNIRRCDVTKKNVLKVLAQKYKVADFYPAQNTAVLGNFSAKMRKAIRFKHRQGEKVLISRSANYTLKSNAFTKKSVEGNYGKRVFVVENAFLKSNAQHFYTMVYKVKGLDGKPLDGVFYSSELIPALFAEDPEAVDEDEAERKKKLAKLKKKREQQ